MADTKVKGLPFAEAIAYLRDKIDLPTRTWTDLWQGMHARAFVVAGAVRAELIADFHNAIRPRDRGRPNLGRLSEGLRRHRFPGTAGRTTADGVGDHG